MRAVVISLLLASACASPPLALPPPLHGTRVSQHFEFTIDRHCLDEKASAALVVEAERAYEHITKLLGPRVRPGDFAGVRPAGPPAEPGIMPRAAPRIPVRVLDRVGRSFTNAQGIEVVKERITTRDLTHEITHWLAGASWPPVDEGFAVYLTERLWGPAAEASLDLRSLVYLDLARLQSLDPNRLDEVMSRVDYDAAGSFVQFLILRYGLPRFLDLYCGARRNYHGAYGQSEHELCEEWQQHIKGLGLRRSREYYRFQARVTIGLQEAGPPLSQRRAEGEIREPP